MAAIGILERFRRWRESLPGNGYFALMDTPPGARPPKDTGVPFAAGAMSVMEYFQAERDQAILARDEARALAREILNAAPGCDRNAWVRRCPWLAEGNG